MIVHNSTNSSNNPANQSSFGSIFLKIFIVLIIVLLLIVFLGLVSLYASTGKQSYASAFLDSIGQHKAALMVDIVGKNPDLTTRISTLDLNKNCEQAWTNNMNPNPVYAASASMSMNVYPVKAEYQDDFNFFNKFDFGFNTNQTAAYFNWDQKSLINTDLAQQISSSKPLVYSPKTVQLESKVKAVANKSDAYLQITDLSVKGADDQASDSLITWYNQNYGFSQIQQDGVVEASGVLKDVLAINPSDMVLESTGKKIVKLSCDLIQDIQVGGIEEVKASPEAEAFKARKIIIVSKSDASDIIRSQAPDILNELAKDNKLKDFLKSQYELAKRAAIAQDKISKSYSSSNSYPQDEYNKAIDDLFKNYNPEEFKQNLEQIQNSNQASNQVDSQPLISFQQEPTVYYLDQSNLQITAAQSRTKILFSDRYLKSTNNLTLQNILEKGVAIDYWAWNIKTNEKVEDIQTPSQNLETMPSIENNLKNTETYKLLEKWSEKNKIQTNLSSKPKVEV